MSELRTLTLIPGDGIGPEISEAVTRILDAAGLRVNWDSQEGGEASALAGRGVMPDATIESIARHKIALKGPTTTPTGGGHQSANVTLRKRLDLYANVRPAKSLPGYKTRFDNIDMIIVRENTEDTYAGIEHMVAPNVAQCLKVITWEGSERVARYAFEMARKLKRKRVTCVHKANIHKLTDGLFLRAHEEVAKEFSDIKFDSIIVDNLCMQLVTRPEEFDVLVLPNLYGDIVSDLCAGLVGGLGVAPGANIGNNGAVFEAVHGSAPDIAGQGKANPTALLLSAVMMLQHMGEFKMAESIESGLQKVLAEGKSLTRDLKGTASTMEFAEAIIRAMKN
ncbi:isocitrate dehydrogenase (NAD(+)) [bacterium]|nr:isocitrate dehydrogenase (NAD(+)) [bacterium]